MARTRRIKTEPPPSDADIDRFHASSAVLGAGLAAVAKDAQTSLRLPQGMYDALSAAAADHRVGIGEEIRARLETSLSLLLGSPETRELMELIVRAAQQVEPAFGSWQKDPFAFAVFSVAVHTLLAYYRPKGEPLLPKPEPGSVVDTFFGPAPTPETAGRAIAMAAVAAGRRRAGE
jgi:hypothetical protein